MSDKLHLLRQGYEGQEVLKSKYQVKTQARPPPQARRVFLCPPPTSPFKNHHSSLAIPLIAEWINKIYENKAEWTPKKQTSTGKETIKWVLDKKFIQGDLISQDGAKKGHWLMNYDEEAKVYRNWFFGNELQFPRGGSVER